MRGRLRPTLRDPRAQTAALLALFLLLPALASAADRGRQPSLPRTDPGERTLDVRDRAGRAPRSQGQRSAQGRLRRSLGRRGVLEVDPSTGTPRRIARIEGFLTGRQPVRAREIALDYVSDNRRAFGLDADDLAGFSVSREYRSTGPLSHVQLRQGHRGVPAYDNGLTANVVGGRLLNVNGSAVPDLFVRSVRPRLGASEAVQRLLAPSRRAGRATEKGGPRRATRFRDGHRADLAIFADPDGKRLAWEVLVFADSQHLFHAAVDASTGEILERSNLTDHAGGLAQDYYPGADVDGVAGSDPAGTPGTKTFPTGGSDPWIASPFNRLRGNNAHTYSDKNDSVNPFLGPNPADEVSPSSGSGTAGASWNYLADFGPPGNPAGRTCPASPISANGCTWNGFGFDSVFTSGNNWETNREQNATQVHYFVNRFHDHLLSAPIGFDESSGNFEGADRVHAQVDDGAATGPGEFPNSNHANNANMSTPPEGSPPLMQMYLFTGKFDARLGDEHDVNGGDDAAVVYHEYVHGLTNRLVTDVNGAGALSGLQSAAMGEAWSDWYMFDFLNAQSPPFQPDGPANGDLVQGDYENAPFVTEATDCAVDVVAARCPHGGYTYADYAKVIGFPEEHADGEIWTQTLWQLRARLIAKYGSVNGIARARQLITGGMRVSGPEPDFLDMRDSIYQTDVADSSKDDLQLMREVFAARGMGACAASDGANDPTPTADFRVNLPAGGCSGGPTPAPPGPPKPTPTPAPKLLSDLGFGGFPRRASLRRVLGRGLAGRISCDVGCAFRASLVLPRRSARRAGFRGRTVVVSRTQGSIGSGGTSRKVRFRFKRSVARRMRRLTRGTGLEVRVSARDSRGTRRTEKKKLTLKR